jgi:hypothetical protein
MPGPFAGSGGGLFGAIGRLIDADANLGTSGYFGGRVYGDEIPRTASGALTGFPFVRLSDISARGARQSDGLLLIAPVFQVSVFEEGRDATAQLSKDLDALLRGARLVVEGQEVTLFLTAPGRFRMIADPVRSENGATVWHAPSQFQTTLGDVPGPGERGEN